MCLITKDPEFVKLKEPLITYKMAYRDSIDITYSHMSIKSHIYKFEYVLGQKYKIKRHVITEDSYLGIFGYYNINEGFHSWLTIPPLFSCDTNIICLSCIIPKGAYVIYGDNNEIVSTKIIIQEILDSQAIETIIEQQNKKHLKN